jgi:transcriptional regulator with XRE-family HTH domain
MNKSFFSANLKSLRKFKKISLEELADATNTSKSAISDYENDKFSPSLFICRKFADFFGTSIDSMEFSEILEIKESGELGIKEAISNPRQVYEANLEIKKLQYKNEKLEIDARLLKQKVESLQIQLRLHDQLKDSKVSEIELLKMQIHLLEENLVLLKKM